MWINNSMPINSLLTPSTTSKDINGSVGTAILRDYRHARKLFIDDDYRLSPKYGFLFYVEFDLNPLITNIPSGGGKNLSAGEGGARELGMLVKSVSLPKYTIDTKIHNAYNRKNIVQNKINYDQVNITFHDDQSDVVRNFWYDYYSFFYRDSDYADATYQGIHKYQSRPTFDWGYSPRATVGYNNSFGNQPYQYIQAIRIYSLYQKNFSEYQLVNPTITAFKHGDHANAGDAGLLEHQMSIQFETVKYRTGYVTENTVGGFVDLHYDNVPSPIAPPDGTDLAPNGQGGYSRASDQIIDLANQNIFYGATLPLYINQGIGGRGSFAQASSLATTFATGSGNNGGYAIPSLGSLTAGISSGAVTGQQIQAAGAALAGSAASTIAGGIISGISAGLGPQGTAIVGMAAQAIANPSAALKTVENMAIKFAMGAVTQTVSNFASQLGGLLSQNISSGIGSLGIGQFFGDVFGDIKNWAFDAFSGIGGDAGPDILA